MDFASIDLSKLFEITQRLLSVETVQDAQAFITKIQEAAQIVEEAGLRIAGQGSRDLNNPQLAVRVATVVAAYYEE